VAEGAGLSEGVGSRQITWPLACRALPTCRRCKVRARNAVAGCTQRDSCTALSTVTADRHRQSVRHVK
jgi:hypothetical protein